MFNDRAFRKKRREKAKAAAASAAKSGASPTPAREPTAGLPTSAAAVTPSAPKAGATSAGVPGLNIEQYARMSGLPEAEVWRRVRRGELVGRNSHGQLLIYELGAVTADHMSDRAGASQASVADLEALPPLPTNLPGAPSNAMTLVEKSAQSQELALLLDHLSLAKEENREILRMTQDSIRKVSEMSDTIVEMKDAVIAAKDIQLKLQQEETDRLKLEMRQLRQHNEDLETLARALAKA